VSACTKARYESRRVARAARRRIVGQGRGDALMRPYWCDACGAWHLGHLASGIRRGNVGRDVYGGDAA